MTKPIPTSIILAFIVSGLNAQPKSTDTVIVELAKTSRVIFTVKDKSDLPILKNYDYQALFTDILKKFEVQDTLILPPTDKQVKERETVEEEETEWPDYKDRNRDTNKDNSWSRDNDRSSRRGTSQSFNFDFGVNNYLEKGKFPDANNANYSIRPWGSWYVGLNSVQKTKLTRKFFLEWGMGVSWYNFKFQNAGVVITKDATSVNFLEDSRDINPRKSKLTAAFLNASFVPVLDFGSNRKKARFWDTNEGFRIGLGPYVGYRIDSYSKFVFRENGGTEKEHKRDNFYLNNVRYGARLQVGYRGTDLFFNYDINELFAQNRGPQLNAFSFGIVF